MAKVAETATRARVNAGSGSANQFTLKWLGLIAKNEMLC